MRDICRRTSFTAIIFSTFCVSRFHDTCLEPVLECDVVLNLDDSCRLPVESYGDRLYCCKELSCWEEQRKRAGPVSLSCDL